MTPELRRPVLLVAVLGLASVLVFGLLGLPDFGHYQGVYGHILNAVAVNERHTTDVVTAVVFDYRGFDTLGEEFILFISVVAVMLLLRESKEEQAEDVGDAVASDAVRAVGVGAVGPALVLGLYVVAHGYITPGGGFQGGVVLASGIALIYVAGEYGRFRALTPSPLLDAGEGIGAGTYAMVGLAVLGTGAAFLANTLPLGTSGTLASAGTIPLINAAVALEVACALVLLFAAFLEELELELVPGGGEEAEGEEEI